MTTTNSAAALVARLQQELAEEEALIAKAVAAKAIGEGSGYWQRAATLRRRLAAARSVAEALEGEG